MDCVPNVIFEEALSVINFTSDEKLHVNSDTSTVPSPDVETSYPFSVSPFSSTVYVPVEHSVTFQVNV